MKNLSFLEDYSTAIIYSLTLCTLIYNLFLIARIRYGDRPINKLTIVPYKISAVYFVVFIIHDIDFQLFTYHLMSDNENYLKYSKHHYALLMTTYGLRNLLLLCWLIYRVYTDHILLAFVDHQSDLRLDELEVSKHIFNE